MEEGGGSWKREEKEAGRRQEGREGRKGEDVFDVSSTARSLLRGVVSSLLFCISHRFSRYIILGPEYKANESRENWCKLMAHVEWGRIVSGFLIVHSLPA